MKSKLPIILPADTPVLIVRVSIGVDRGSVFERVDEYAGRITDKFYVLTHHRSTDTRRSGKGNEDRDFERENHARNLPKDELYKFGKNRNDDAEAYFTMWVLPGMEHKFYQNLAKDCDSFFLAWNRDIEELIKSVDAQHINIWKHLNKHLDKGEEQP